MGGDRQMYDSLNRGHFSKLSRDKFYLKKEDETRRHQNTAPIKRTSFFGSDADGEVLPLQLGQLRASRAPRSDDIITDIQDPMAGSWSEDFALAAAGETPVSL